MTYTEGEWVVVDDYAFIDIMAGPQIMVASLRKDYPNAEANAYLIAAAPKMYEALKSYQEANRLHNDSESELFDKAENALAKAERR